MIVHIKKLKILFFKIISTILHFYEGYSTYENLIQLSTFETSSSTSDMSVSLSSSIFVPTTETTVLITDTMFRQLFAATLDGKDMYIVKYSISCPVIVDFLNFLATNII